MTHKRHLTLLKYDVKAWNSWRQENNRIELDFSGANLSDLNLSGVNLSRVNLSKVNFSRTNLKCADLKRANLSQACLIEADLRGSDLSEVELTEADLTRADLSSANLTNANLTNANALVTNFKNSILTGACLENWQIDNRTNLEDLVCDYFYAKRRKQQRYPRDERQNFAPGEYDRFIRNTFNYVDSIVPTNSDSKEDNQPRLDQSHNLLESIDNTEEEGRGHSPAPLISSSIASIDKIKQKNSILNLSLAFLLGIVLTAIALGQIFNQETTSSDNLINCDKNLLEQAENAIFTRDRESLNQVMQQLEEFNSPLGNFADDGCRQTLYEVKYVYAIHVHATKDNNLLEAVKLLCELPEEYYQKRNHKPWFLRWVNSFANTSFPQQLAAYLKANECPAANYLTQNN